MPRDPARGDAGVARRRIELVVAQNRLNQTDVRALLQQVRGEAVPQRMQGDGSAHARGFEGRWKRRLSGILSAAYLACVTEKRGAPLGGTPASKRIGRSFHHCRKSSSTSSGSMTWWSLRPLDCTTRMTPCALSTSPALSLATSPARSRARSGRQHDPQSEAARPPATANSGPASSGFEGQRQVQRLFDAIDFRREIVPTQRYPE